MKILKLLSVAAASVLFLSAVFAESASAASYIVINDASTIKFAVQDNKVYFRNLNEYDSSWLPCCFNYYIDLTTESGKAQFATLLSFHMAGKKLTMWKTDFGTAGVITIVGNF